MRQLLLAFFLSKTAHTGNARYLFKANPELRTDSIIALPGTSDTYTYVQIMYKMPGSTRSGTVPGSSFPPVPVPRTWYQVLGYLGTWYQVPTVATTTGT